MSIWSLLLLFICFVVIGLAALVVWASIDVRRRFQMIDADEALLIDEAKVMGCEGDCNTCPLVGLHADVRARIRASQNTSVPSR